MKGYKVFNSDWKCKDFQYKVGETFKHDGEIEICSAGFHFCQKLADCFGYYTFNSENKVAEIEAVGNIKTDGDKFVTDEIKIVREITWNEVLDMVNTGKGCTGLQNSGDYNSGNCNSGNCNSGDFNSGYCNSGDRNSGDRNSGNCNSGNHNSGNHNSGNFNSGNCNSGDWNSRDFSNGFFNSVSPPLYVFNKPLNISRNEFYSCDGVSILRQSFSGNIWIFEKDMTGGEKKNHPEYETTGGYLKTLDFKTACKNMWENLSDSEKQKVCEIPNFDAKIFREITGIDVTERGNENAKTEKITEG